MTNSTDPNRIRDAVVESLREYWSALPASELTTVAEIAIARVAEEVENHAKDLMGAAVDRVMSDDPGGQLAAMRAATVTYTARYMRGETNAAAAADTEDRS